MSLLSGAYQAKKCLETEINRDGETITLRKVTQGTYNPATGTTTDTVEDITLTAIVKDTISDQASKIIENNDRIEGTVTPWNMSIVFQHTEKPTKEWKVIHDTKEYEVILVHPRKLSGILLSYELVLKR